LTSEAWLTIKKWNAVEVEAFWIYAHLDFIVDASKVQSIPFLLLSFALPCQSVTELLSFIPCIKMLCPITYLRGNTSAVLGPASGCEPGQAGPK